MTPNDFVFWLSGFLTHYEDEWNMDKEDVMKIKQVLKTVNTGKMEIMFHQGTE